MKKDKVGLVKEESKIYVMADNKQIIELYTELAQNPNKDSRVTIRINISRA